MLSQALKLQASHQKFVVYIFCCAAFDLLINNNFRVPLRV